MDRTHATSDDAATVTLGDARTLRTTSSGRLARLGDLTQVGIVDGEPDIRGWEVKGPLGNRVGEVSELLVDTGAMAVRYLEVRFDVEVAQRVADAAGDTDPRVEPSRYALVPIGIARLDPEHSRVYLAAGAAQLVGLPPSERHGLTRKYERTLLGAYGLDAREDGGDRAAGVDGAGDEHSDEHFYDKPCFDEHTCFGPRRRADESPTYLVPVV